MNLLETSDERLKEMLEHFELQAYNVRSELLRRDISLSKLVLKVPEYTPSALCRQTLDLFKKVIVNSPESYIKECKEILIESLLNPTTLSDRNTPHKNQKLTFIDEYLNTQLNQILTRWKP